jgi:hypothetical protein
MELLFAEPEPNRFESSDGYSVEILGRSRIKYSEKDRSTSIQSEALATIGSMALYDDSLIHWDSPHEAELLTIETRNKIISRVDAAFAWRGYKLEVM